MEMKYDKEQREEDKCKKRKDGETEHEDNDK